MGVSKKLKNYNFGVEYTFKAHSHQGYIAELTLRIFFLRIHPALKSLAI